jgi:hypothetical protein
LNFFNCIAVLVEVDVVEEFVSCPEKRKRIEINILEILILSNQELFGTSL